MASLEEAFENNQLRKLENVDVKLTNNEIIKCNLNNLKLHYIQTNDGFKTFFDTKSKYWIRIQTIFPKNKGKYFGYTDYEIRKYFKELFTGIFEK
jgi:hypothetical protein